MWGLTPWTKRGGLLPRAEEVPLSRMFRRFFEEWPEMIEEWVPRWATNVEEMEKEVVARFEMPGFEPAEVKVELKGETLVVEAEHKEPAEKGKEEPKTYAHVKRVVTLPPEIEPEKAEAVYRNGILEVRVPRKPEVVGRRIEVKV